MAANIKEVQKDCSTCKGRNKVRKKKIRGSPRIDHILYQNDYLFEAIYKNYVEVGYDKPLDITGFYSMIYNLALEFHTYVYQGFYPVVESRLFGQIVVRNRVRNEVSIYHNMKDIWDFKSEFTSILITFMHCESEYIRNSDYERVHEWFTHMCYIIADYILVCRHIFKSIAGLAVYDNYKDGKGEGSDKGGGNGDSSNSESGDGNGGECGVEIEIEITREIMSLYDANTMSKLSYIRLKRLVNNFIKCLGVMEIITCRSVNIWNHVYVLYGIAILRRCLGVCLLAGKLERIEKNPTIIGLDGDLGEIKSVENPPVVLSSPKWKLLAKMKKRDLSYMNDID